MQQLFLPEFRYIKGSITPDDSTSNLPAELFSKRIKKNSHLLSLSPFFDKNNVSRVGGRLANSPYSVDKKFPIIIPKTSHPRKSFEKPSVDPRWPFLTSGKVWIPRGIASVKVIHNCEPCIRFDVRIRQPLTGDLPEERIVESFAFQFKGVDYCGPFYTKFSLEKLKKVIRRYFHFFHHKGNTLRASGKSNQRRLVRYPQEFHRKTRNSPSNLQWQFDNVHWSPRRTRIQRTSSRLRFQGSHQQFCEPKSHWLVYYTTQDASFWRTVGNSC